MSSLTNGNDHKRGWEEGRQAALEGKDKDYSRMGLSWKFVFHGSTALDSYSDGYDSGYEAGMNERNVIRKVEFSNINNNSDMDYNSSQAQDLDREIWALKDLNNFLVNRLCNRIRQVDGLFAQYIKVMAGTGVPFQACQTFESQNYMTDQALFQKIFERIVDFDLPQIRTYIEMIQSQFHAATGMDFGSVKLDVPSDSISAILPNNAVLNSGSTQSLQLQISGVCNLMDFLVGRRDELQMVMSDYEKYCNDMISSGVPEEIVDHYIPNYAQVNVQFIRDISNNIQYVDYPYLSTVYGQIADSLSKIGQSPQRAPLPM